jgi:hypothetical protein
MELVLVHLGPGRAKHIPYNIKHIQRYFSEYKISLIVTEDAHPSILNLPAIKYFKYERSSEIASSIEKLKHNGLIRNGFWIYSLERIFALSEWAKLNKTVNFLHIESDVLLMTNFPMRDFEKCKKIAWTRYNQDRDVATFIYSPNYEEIAWVTSELIKLIEINPSLTDMTGLSTISKDHPNRVRILPSAPTELVAGESGIFDPAPFGMWLTGQDPRNNWGFTRKFISLHDSISAPEKFHYSASSDGTLTLSDLTNSYFLFNLHVHSKRINLFNKNWIKNLQKDAKLAGKGSIKSNFSLKVFYSIFFEANSRYKGLLKKLRVATRLVFMKTR